MTDKEPPVSHAIRTKNCTTCGAAPGIACKVEVHEQLHDGAHRARLDGAAGRAP